MSMHLLNRYYSAHHQLFNNAVQAQVKERNEFLSNEILQEVIYCIVAGIFF
jgi:hypothetical protein